VEYINPIFKNKNTINDKTKKTSVRPQQPQNPKVRAYRSDKQHNIKFVVTPVLQMKLKSFLRVGKKIYERQGKNPNVLTQTKFNTSLLRFGLKNPNLIKWDWEYRDSKIYMHTQLLKKEYEMEIGGAHGLTVRKRATDRKVVSFIIYSVIQWLEGSGDLEKII
jgi:hypothetical protein